MAEPTPFLHVDAPDGNARAVALVLHGGRSKSIAPVRANQLAVLRMAPFVSHLRKAGAGHGLAVARMRYRERGWNGAEQSPVRDVRWALDQLGQQFPGAPVALVGHSMGGRAAVYAAGHPSVAAVVGLAPWLERGDPVAQVAGRRLLVLHGDLDRMTSPIESASFVRHAAQVAASAAYVAVEGERHPMLRRAGVWHRFATGYVLAVICDEPPSETISGDMTNSLEKVLAGEPSITV